MVGEKSVGYQILAVLAAAGIHCLAFWGSVFNRGDGAYLRASCGVRSITEWLVLAPIWVVISAMRGGF